MLKLSFSKPKVYVKPDNKLVVVVYNCSLNDKAVQKAPLSEFHVVGKAFCAEDDAFDAKLGTSIADSRAKKEAYKRVALIASSGISHHAHAAKAFNRWQSLYDKMMHLSAQESEHFNRIVNEGND